MKKILVSRFSFFVYFSLVGIIQFTGCRTVKVLKKEIHSEFDSSAAYIHAVLATADSTVVQKEATEYFDAVITDADKSDIIHAEFYNDSIYGGESDAAFEIVKTEGGYKLFPGNAKVKVFHVELKNKLRTDSSRTIRSIAADSVAVKHTISVEDSGKTNVHIITDTKEKNKESKSPLALGFIIVALGVGLLWYLYKRFNS